MRQFKFRVWDTGWRHWLTGLTYTLHTSGNLIDLHEELVLMQWTGLQDCNGNDVYEGDVLAGHIYRYGYEVGEDKWMQEYKGVVQWVQRNQLYGFYLVDECGDYMPLLYATHRNEDFNGDPPAVVLEIIGNMYEHSELLNAKGE